MRGAGARAAAAQAAHVLKLGAGVYLFREWVVEPPLVWVVGVVVCGRKDPRGGAEPPPPPPSQCVGPSMLPTFNARGDVVLLESATARRGALRVGDVVVARSPSDPRHAVCKRVLGLPGDVVQVGDPAPGWHGGDHGVPVPPGHVWLQGDNARNSTDSRAYGPVPLALVRGRVFARVWPPGGGGGGGGAAPDWARQRHDGQR